MVKSNSNPGGASARPADDILRLAESINLALAKAKSAWPDIDHRIALHASVVMAQARRDGVKLDISSFAVSVGLSRSTASRMLRDWERRGYCRLDRGGNRTVICQTESMRAEADRVFEAVAARMRDQNDSR